LDQVRPDSPDFVKNRVAMQDLHMKEIWRYFDADVRAIIFRCSTMKFGARAASPSSSHPPTRTSPMPPRNRASLGVSSSSRGKALKEISC